MSKLVLYGLETSPPVRACKLTLQALNLSYDYKLLDLFKNEHKTEEYTQKNPQHTVPLLEDNGRSLWESHAISAYLVRKYGKTDELYPRDYYKRAIVDQGLHFESGVLFQGCLRNIAMPLLFQNVTEVPREKINAIYESYDFMEQFLNRIPFQSFFCGHDLTIADFSCVSTVSSLTGLAPIDPDRYPKLRSWIQRMEQLPYYEDANGVGARRIVFLFKKRISKIQ